MNIQEQKLKKKIQIIVAACMSVFFILVIVVVFQFAIRMNQRAELSALKGQQAALKKQIDLAEKDTAYFLSEQFKKDILLRWLNTGKPGDVIVDD